MDVAAIHVLLVVLWSFFATCKADIPVLIWGYNREHYRLKQPLGLCPLKSESVKDVLKYNYFKKNLIVIFFEETLSVEDFILRTPSNKTVFIELKKISLAEEMLYTSVQSPSFLLAQRIWQFGTVTKDGWQCDTKLLRKNLVLTFKDRNLNESRTSMLQRHDILIKNTYSTMKQKVRNIVCIYSGLESPRFQSKREINNMTQDRGVLEYSNYSVNTQRGGFYKGDRRMGMNEDSKNQRGKSEHCKKDCFYEASNKSSTILLYAPVPPKLKVNKTVHDLTDFATSVYEVNSTYIILNIKFVNAVLRFHFMLHDSLDWEMNAVSIEANGKVTVLSGNRAIEAKKGQSYHCSDMTQFSNSSVQVTFNGMQVEPFFRSTNFTENDDDDFYFYSEDYDDTDKEPQLRKKFNSPHKCVTYSSVVLLVSFSSLGLIIFFFTLGMAFLVTVKINTSFDERIFETEEIDFEEYHEGD